MAYQTKPGLIDPQNVAEMVNAFFRNQGLTIKNAPFLRKEASQQGYPRINRGFRSELLFRQPDHETVKIVGNLDLA